MVLVPFYRLDGDHAIASSFDKHQSPHWFCQEKGAFQLPAENVWGYPRPTLQGPGVGGRRKNCIRAA